MKRRDFLKAAGYSAMVLGLPGTLKAKKRANKPNIIYMVLDEWGYYEMSSLGHTKLKTPVFDEFRKEGMRFTQVCFRRYWFNDITHKAIDSDGKYSAKLEVAPKYGFLSCKYGCVPII